MQQVGRSISGDVFRTVAGLAFEFVFILKPEPDGPPTRIWASGPYLELTGYTLEETDPSGGFLKFIHPDDLKAVEKAFEEAVATDEAVIIEFRVENKDGTTKWLRSWLKRVTGEDGDTYIHGATQQIDELKQADEERRRSEERYRAISELTSDYAFSAIVGEDGSFEYEWDTDAGPGTHSLYTPDEVARAGWENFILEEDLPKALAAMEELQAGKATAVELRVKTRNDVIEWMRAYCHPVIDPNSGRLTRIFGALQYITENKRANEAMVESESRYRQLVESSPDGIALHSKGIVVYVNPAAVQLLGAENPEQLVGRPVLEFVPVESHEFVKRRMQQVHEAGHIDVAEEQLVREDGTRVQVEVTGSLVSYAGEPAIQLVIRDISERKAALRALAENQRLLQQLTDTISEVFFVHDGATGNALFVSPAYKEIWGRPVSTLHEDPSSWFKAVHAEDRERVRLVSKRAQDEPYEIEYRIVRPDGTQRWVVEIGAPVRNERGTIVRVAGVVRDVTERKRLEEQLMQSQKMEAIGRLAGGVAHDFNNLLMVVLNSARFLREDLKTDPARVEDVDQIIDAGERAAVLVRQLLAYSRKQLVSPKVVSLNDIVADMKTLLERTIGEDVALMTRLSEDLWLTEVDPHQMEQVVLNLIVNARDWMPSGGTVSMETSNVFIDDESARLHGGIEPGEYACLAISDTGSGIDKALLEQIFEPFFSTKPKSEATGLGLSMVFGIVTQAGGQVIASSEPGMGSTFRVYLPASRKEKELHEVPKVRVSRGGSGLTVLVAEDDEQVCEITTRILSRQGFDVIQAHSGDRALALAREHGGMIDVLLTDVVMPKMSGRELASRMRLLSPETKVVYMSGYTADIIGRHGILDADDNYLPKPFTSEELFERIERALGTEA